MKKYLFLILVILSVPTFAEVTVFGGVNLNGKAKIKVSSSEEKTTEIASKNSEEIGYTIGIETHKQVAKISDIDFKLGLGVKYETSIIFKEFNGDVYASTLPFYGSAKLSFPSTNEVNIYIQGTLGFVILFEGKVLKDQWEELQNNTKSETKSIEFGGELYKGIGVGMETERYNLGLTYNITNYGCKRTWDSKFLEEKLEYSKVTLAVGYKF